MSHQKDWEARLEIQRSAPKTLRDAWDDWADACQAADLAKKAYFAAATGAGIKLCTCCAKPMPEYDNSQTCDGCHLGWGWDTPQGRRDRRAAELDEQLERLRAERAKL